MRKCPVTNKTIFTSLTHIESFMMQDEARRQLRPYWCDHCSGYHVTSMSIKDANKYLGTKPLKYANEFKKYMK